MKCDNWWMIKKKGLKPFFLKYNIIKNLNLLFKDDDFFIRNILSIFFD